MICPHYGHDQSDPFICNICGENVRDEQPSVIRVEPQIHIHEDKKSGWTPELVGECIDASIKGFWEGFRLPFVVAGILIFLLLMCSVALS
jgi:hypothetical protein